MSLDYYVRIDKLKDLAYELFREVPVKAMRETAKELAFVAAMNIHNESPSSLASGRGYRGSPLRLSVTTQSIGKDYYVAPMKMVGGLYLGTLIEKGSTNQRIIRPVVRKYMKFPWRGQVWFAKSVKRGIIPPNTFIDRAAQRTSMEAGHVMRDTFIKYLNQVKTGMTYA